MFDFSTAVVRWQKKHGRHTLPWQQNADPYKIWLSEIMLQQTQVAAVIPYYKNFICRFPTLAMLARARESSVLAAWSGLGYYARARHLHAAAKIMHKNGIPTDAAGWQALPGIGKSTAAAVAVFSHNQRCAILDGNVKRLLARTHLLPQPTNTSAGEAALWRIAEHMLPTRRYIRPYTQGLMDLGATVCRRQKPLCSRCPLTAHCLAHQQGLTAQYPRRQAKKEKPKKAVHFILIRTNDKVLLQQQPAKGIWGGLWSLPLFDNGEKYWQDTLSTRLCTGEKLSFTHEFTHYRLQASVSSYHCPTAPSVAMPLRWHGRWKNIALPTPIRKLLTEA